MKRHRNGTEMAKLLVANALKQGEAKKLVKLIDGPLRGTTVEIPRSAERHTVGYWTYQYAGKDGREELFARIPNTSREKRFVEGVIRFQGRHPRLLMAKNEPYRNPLSKEERIYIRHIERRHRLGKVS